MPSYSPPALSRERALTLRSHVTAPDVRTIQLRESNETPPVAALIQTAHRRPNCMNEPRRAITPVRTGHRRVKFGLVLLVGA
jgi:hypothetical protein